MTLFYLSNYICILTIITFFECNYVKCALKEMSFRIKYFIMKLAFYHLNSYVEKFQNAAEEMIKDRMNVQTDDWVAVTYENNRFPDIVFNVQSINSSHSILSITLLNYLMGIDPSLKFARKGDEKFAQSVDGGERGGLSYIFIGIALKVEIFHHIFD